jgi:hypothetical protein
MYKDLVQDKVQYSLQIPNTTVPSPTETDYESQFINRYFIQRVNDDNGFIFEVDDVEYLNLETNPYWKKIKIRWRIAGPIEPVYNELSLIDVGVKKSNQASIFEASRVLKNIGLYLPNILQFHK